MPNGRVPPSAFGISTRRNRRRKIAPRRQPVPQLVEVVRKISLEVCDRLSVYSSRSLVGLHTFEGFPDFPLGDVERLCLVRGLLPSPVGPRARLTNAAPSVQLHYRAFIPTTNCSAPVLRFGTLVLAVGARLDVSLGIGATGSHVPYKSLVERRKRIRRCRNRGVPLPPGSAWENPEACPSGIRHCRRREALHRRFACARLSQPCLPGNGAELYEQVSSHRELLSSRAMGCERCGNVGT
jgi:hypothetical protein